MLVVLTHDQQQSSVLAGRMQDGLRHGAALYQQLHVGKGFLAASELFAQQLPSFDAGLVLDGQG